MHDRSAAEAKRRGSMRPLASAEIPNSRCLAFEQVSGVGGEFWRSRWRFQCCAKSQSLSDGPLGPHLRRPRLKRGSQTRRSLAFLTSGRRRWIQRRA